MSDEALRALEKKWRDDGRGCEESGVFGPPLVLYRCADELAAILSARQEVAPVADSELPGMWSASDFTGGDPDERCHAERVPVAAQEVFTAWFCLNYPGPHTIISDPNWHAPRIFRQAQWAIKQSSPAHTSEARDAARYRWLLEEAGRDKRGSDHDRLHVSINYPTKMADGSGYTGLLVTPRGDEFDSRVDAAMRQEAGDAP